MSLRDLRFTCDLSNPNNLRDVGTGLPPTLLRGSSVSLQIGLFDHGVIVSELTGIDSVTLIVKSSPTAAEAVLQRTILAAAFESCDLEGWTDGSEQHVSFDLDDEDTDFAAGSYVFALRALVDDVPLIIGYGTLKMIDTAGNPPVADDDTDPADVYYTRTEIDELFSDGLVTAQASAQAAAASAETATTQAGTATTKAGEAAASAQTATTQAGTATTQAGIATTKAGEAAGDRVQTGLDRVATGQDAIATAADRVQTGLDRVATGDDAEDTAADRVATGQDKIATAADRVQTGLDRVATGDDAEDTAADRVATGQDVIATAADRVQTGLDRVATGQDKIATAADRVQTGLDRVATTADAVATAADRVQTGLDRTAAGGSATAAAASATDAALISAGLTFVDTVAGASVPATSTAAGYFYLIDTAGTSQSKTWAVGDLAVYKGTSGQWAQVASSSALASSVLANIAGFRNSLARGGALYFDGAGGKVYSALTGQAITTDDLALSGWFEVGTSNPAANLGLLALSSSNSTAAQANAIVTYVDTARTLRARVYGATTDDYNEASISLVPWAGEESFILVKRVGTVATIYINGVAKTVATATGGTPPTWAASITNTYLTVGLVSASVSFVGVISHAAFWNFAPTDAEVMEFFKRKRVPFRYRYGRQANCIANVSRNSDFSDGATDWVGSSGGSCVVSGGALNCTLPKSVNSRVKLDVGNLVGVPTVSCLIEVSFDVANFVGDDPPFILLLWRIGGDVNTYFTSADGRKVIVFTKPAGLNQYISIVYGGNGIDCTVTLDNFKVRVLGAVVYLPLDGGGPQARDESTNELDGDISISGVTPTIAAPIGTRRQIRKTYAHSDISSPAATTSPGWLPAGWVVRELNGNVTSAFDANTTLNFGISGTAAKYASALAIATTGFKRADSLSVVRESKTDNTTVYVQKNQSTTSGAIELVWIIERIS